MIPALLVGSQPSWRRQIDAILFAHGIEVAWWWPTPSHLSDIPAGARVVIVATDNCSHKLSKPAMERARKADVALVCGPHRKAAMSPLLERQGFPLLATLAEGIPAPFDLTHVAIATLPSSLILDLPMLDAAAEPEPVTVPVPEEPAMPPTAPPIALPPVAPPAGFASLNSTALDLYVRALPIVAHNPWITAAEVAGMLGAPSGSLFLPIRLVREALGIKAGVGAGATRIIDRARYERGCMVLGKRPVVLNEGPTRPPGTAKERNGGDRGQPGRTGKSLAPAAALAALLPAPEPTPVPEAPTPAPTPAPAPEDLRDTKEAMRLLLEAMRAEGVEHIAVNADGTAEIRRRVVVTSTFSL